MQYLIALVLVGCAATAFDSTTAELTACSVHVPAGTSTPADALWKTMASAHTCPKSVKAFRAMLQSAGATLEPSMVANRGFHNPDAGSFSFFEHVVGLGTGEFFFGHFTERQDDGTLALQASADGQLMIEAIAWDPSKQVFNFYELVGTSWFYRGDSLGIAQDLVGLHQGQPIGTSMRCSGCHMGGGPIMKEQAPFNDWWRTAHPLPLGAGDVHPDVAAIMQDLQDASALSALVEAGQQRLAQSATWKARDVSWRTKLRPLFCPEELQLIASDDAAEVPSDWLVDPRLAQGALQVSGYAQALTAVHSHFPETNAADADHPWLAPVKAHSDMTRIAALGLPEHVVNSVLSVDFTAPVFSAKRCALLQYVPEQENDWLTQFIANLQAAGEHDLVAALEGGALPDAQAFLAACSQQNATSLLQTLVARRAQVATSEISSDPRGQILEPGFRLIFPVANSTASPELLPSCTAP